MRLLSTMAALGLSVTATSAFAWGDMGGGYMNEFIPTTNEVAIWAYPSKHNYCPAGLQPVMALGSVSCGTPTHAGHPSPPVHRAPSRGTYIATGKGMGEGYYADDADKVYIGN